MYHILVCFSFVFFFLPSNCLSFIVLGLHMYEFSLPYIGFTDGSSHSIQNLASAAWAIYAPTDELISLLGICLGRETNNIA